MAIHTPIIAGLVTVGALKFLNKRGRRGGGRKGRGRGRRHRHHRGLSAYTYPYYNYPSYYGYAQCNALCVSPTATGALVLHCRNQFHPWNGMDVTAYSSCYTDASGVDRCIVNIGNGLDVPVCVTR